MKSPFFSRLFQVASRWCCPTYLEVPTSGFGYPLVGVKSFSSLEASFSSPRSWASPFKALLLPRGQTKISSGSLRSRAFTQNLFGLVSAPQRLSPPRKAVPLFASRRISSGRDLLLSWAFGPLGLSLLPTDGKSISLFPFPFRPWFGKSSRTPRP